MIVGMLRIKNEARWIEKVLLSILPVCDKVIVLDDHSDDQTPFICASLPKVNVIESPFSGLDEVRDKRFLMDEAVKFQPEWIVAIDGDEVLAPGSSEKLLDAMKSSAQCLSLRIRYLWDREDQVRVDGVYGDFHRESVFRPNGARFESNGNGGNFHCGNVPWGNRQKREVLNDVSLLHLGYMHRADRERKFVFYTAADPNNAGEDFYRHLTQGDPGGVSADKILMHGGPLRLESLN